MIKVKDDKLKSEQRIGGWTMVENLFYEIAKLSQAGKEKMNIAIKKDQ